MNTPTQAYSADLHPHELISKSIRKIVVFNQALSKAFFDVQDDYCPVDAHLMGIAADLNQALAQLKGVSQ